MKRMQTFVTYEKKAINDVITVRFIHFDGLSLHSRAVGHISRNFEQNFIR